ncbi:MAG TPA: pyridoxamine 5'-phosphate oxidase family protein, partial [Polyangiaceae bacterium]
ASGKHLCVTVTLVDGIVLARSAFHHSMNYRSVVIYGEARAVTERAEKIAVSDALVNRFAPGRAELARRPNDLELKATLMLALPIHESSAKMRTGGPIDDEEDLALPVWAGVVPVALHTLAPITAEPTSPELAPPTLGVGLSPR